MIEKSMRNIPEFFMGGSKGNTFVAKELERKPKKDNLKVQVFNAEGKCVYSGFASAVSVR